MIYVLNKIFCCDPFETIDLPTSYKLLLFFDLVGVDVYMNHIFDEIFKEKKTPLTLCP